MPGLGPEPLRELRGFEELLAEDLDRDGATEHLVARPPHLTHAAGRDPLAQGVSLAELQQRCRVHDGPFTRETAQPHTAPPRYPDDLGTEHAQIIEAACSATARDQVFTRA